MKVQIGLFFCGSNTVIFCEGANTAVFLCVFFVKVPIRLFCLLPYRVMRLVFVILRLKNEKYIVFVLVVHVVYTLYSFSSYTFSFPIALTLQLISK